MAWIFDALIGTLSPLLTQGVGEHLHLAKPFGFDGMHGFNALFFASFRAAVHVRGSFRECIFDFQILESQLTSDLLTTEQKRATAVAVVLAFR